MTSPAIDPSPLPARPDAGRRALGKTVVMALQVALYAAGLAGVAAGAIWLVSEPVAPRPRSEVRLARVQDWPEIKDGIPAVAPAPAPTAAALPSLPAPESQAPSPAEPAAASLPAVEAPASPPATVNVVPVSSESTALANPPATPPEADPREITEPAAVVTPPLPPPAPRRTTQEKVRPRKEQAARPPQRTAAARPSQPPKPEAAPPPKEEAKPAPDDRIRVFGVPLPTGRDIKETFESIGDAVMGRPNRS